MAILFQENASGCFFLQRGGNGAAKKRTAGLSSGLLREQSASGLFEWLALATNTHHSMRRHRHTPFHHTRSTAFLHRNDAITIPIPKFPASHQYW
jgi:hypothetical protein